MTSLSVSRAMSGDPIPDKSQQLFMVQIDSWGPVKPDERNRGRARGELKLHRCDGLDASSRRARQTPIYSTLLKVKPADPKLKPAQAVVPAVSADFFAMFQAPFKFGGPWTQADDEDGNPVVVISRKLNDQFFGGHQQCRQIPRAGRHQLPGRRRTGSIGRWCRGSTTFISARTGKSTRSSSRLTAQLKCKPR